MAAPSITRTPVSVPADNVISAYEPIIFECSWTEPSGTTAPRIECAVYHGSGATLLGTLKKESIDVGGGSIRYRFNVSDMLKTALSGEFITNASTDEITSGNENLATSFYCVFTPKYTGTDSNPASDTATTSSTYYVGNGIIQPNNNLRVFDTGNTLTLTGTSSVFLTYSPQNMTLYSGEDYQLSFFYLGSNQLELNYQTYNLGGNANSAQTVALKTITNKEGTFTITDNGANTIIDDFANISAVDVWIEDSAASQLSQKKKFLISQNCVDGYRLAWLNSLGGYDKFTFKNYKNKTYNVDKRLNFTKPNDDTPIKTERNQTTLGHTGREIYTAVSDFVPTSYGSLFRDLLTSTDVYLQANLSTYYPAIIRSTEQVMDDSDGLVQVVIEFELSKSVKNRLG